MYYVITVSEHSYSKANRVLNPLHISLHFPRLCINSALESKVFLNRPREENSNPLPRHHTGLLRSFYPILQMYSSQNESMIPSIAKVFHIILHVSIETSFRFRPRFECVF